MTLIRRGHRLDAEGPARVVDEQAATVTELISESVDRGLVGDVERQGSGGAADLLGESPEALEAPGAQHHVKPLSSEAAGGCRADPA